VKILVLGCGPAGLLAAHAASFLPGTEVKIVSRNRPSDLFGCQYLHGPVPGLDLATTTVNYTLVGTVGDYAAKVYAGAQPGPVSPEQFAGARPVWDIRQAYRQLYDTWFDAIEDVELAPELIRPMLDHLAPDLVVSSVPLPVVCQRPGEHAFTSQTCWALGDAPELGQGVPVPCPEDTVICNGTDDTGWYRVSKVFGHKTAEWPGLRPRPPFAGVVPFHKPLATTCDCWQDPQDGTERTIMRVGRYGTWTKGVLSHEAFNRVFAVLTGVTT
jgi:hypothetical protein